MYKLIFEYINLILSKFLIKKNKKIRHFEYQKRGNSLISSDHKMNNIIRVEHPIKPSWNFRKLLFWAILL